MKTTLLVAAIVTGSALAVSAQGREGNAPRMEMPAFEELDLNGDGAITPEEVATARQASADARFAATDTNGDGGLSADELIARVEAARQERVADRIADQIEKADANGDGVLQADELQRRGGARDDNADRGERTGNRVFDRFDEDEDGTLSADEYAAMQERMQDRADRGPRNSDRGQRDDN